MKTTTEHINDQRKKLQAQYEEYFMILEPTIRQWIEGIRDYPEPTVSTTVYGELMVVTFEWRVKPDSQQCYKVEFAKRINGTVDRWEKMDVMTDATTWDNEVTDDNIELIMEKIRYEEGKR